MDELMSVGQLARRAGLTAKALRHYDHLGLFTPECVDAAGYRWYTSGQLDSARLISRLRSVDVPLDDVRRCLADKTVVIDVLRSHEERLSARLTRLRGDLHEIHHLLTDSGELPVTHDPQPLDHRRLGVDLFNGTWALLEKEDRTFDDNDQMVHMVHASCHHWRQVGQPAHLARGEWQCSRVYAVLGRAEPAMHHATRALEICIANGISDWDVGFCYEAIARAHAVAGDAEAARTNIERALAVDIADNEDRAMLSADLETIPGVHRFW